MTDKTNEKGGTTSQNEPMEKPDDEDEEPPTEGVEIVPKTLEETSEGHDKLAQEEEKEEIVAVDIHPTVEKTTTTVVSTIVPNKDTSTSPVVPTKKNPTAAVVVPSSKPTSSNDPPTATGGDSKNTPMQTTQAEEEEQQERRGLSWMSWIALTIGWLVVVGLLLGILLVLMQNRNDDETQTVPPTNNNNTPDDGDLVRDNDDIIDSASPTSTTFSSLPTMSPASVDLQVEAAIELIHFVVPTANLEKETPSYRAVEWMITQDPKRDETNLSNQNLPEIDFATLRSLQRWALVALYYQTEGAGWIDQLNFLTGLDICEWHEDEDDNNNNENQPARGVFCGDIVDDQVVAIRLPFNGLSSSSLGGGGLDVAIWSVFRSSLQVVDLASNEIDISLPTLPSLPTLLTLNMSNTSLFGPIPYPIIDRSSADDDIPSQLQILDFSGNDLTGNIPRDSFLELPNLETLNLANNRLGGDIGVVLARDRRSLEDYPTEPWFAQMQNLQRLYLNGNDLTGWLSWNLFTSTTSLLIMDLSNNQFTGTLPLFEGIQSLVVIDLSQNMLTGILTQELFTVPTLSILDLSQNFITGSIPHLLEDNYRLTVLSLFDNEIQGPIPTSFGRLPSLSVLDLSYNNLVGTIPPTLPLSLKVLYLSRNFLESNLDQLVLGKDLQELSLRHTVLTGSIPTGLDAFYPSLRLLDLGENTLTGTIPTTLGELRDLQFLFLHENQLTGSVPVELSTLTALVLLHLDANFLEDRVDPLCQLVEDWQLLSLTTDCLDAVICSCCTCCNSVESRDDVGCDQDLDVANIDFSITNSLVRSSYTFSDDFQFEVVAVDDTTLLLEDILDTVIEGDDIVVVDDDATVMEDDDVADDDATVIEDDDFGDEDDSLILDDDLRQRLEEGILFFQLYNIHSSSLNTEEFAAIYWLAITDPTIPEFKEPDADQNIVQRFALVVFFYIMHGYDWTRQLDFLSKAPECDWNDGKLGAFCEKDGEVTHLLLPENNLTGYLSPSFMNLLTSLEVMDLRSNTITGYLPFLGELSNLQTLDLGKNQIAGSLPQVLTYGAGTNSLLELDLSDNSLQGAISIAFTQEFDRLKKISLSNNQLTGTLPYLYFPVSYDYIFMENNRLTGTIPDAYLDYSIQVDLSGNLFAGTLPTTLFRSTTLEILDLSRNMISGEMPAILSPNGAMTVLSLFDNQISGDIPTSIKNLENLSILDLARNEFVGLPIQMPLSMTSLFMSENPLQPQLHLRFLAHVQSLQELSLRGTGLSGTIPEDFGSYMTNLKFLDLSENELQGKLPTSFGWIKPLRFLLLGNNFLTGVVPRELAELVGLELLHLEMNELTGSVDHLCAGKIVSFITDCGVIECPCCTECCTAPSVSCGLSKDLANIDLNVETGFVRREYVFSEFLTFEAAISDLNFPTMSPTKSDQPFVTPSHSVPSYPYPSFSRLDYFIQYLLGLGANVALTVSSNLAYRAVEWIADEDPLFLPIPAKDDLRVLERWAMVYLFFSTFGDEWYNAYNFLSYLDVCNWNAHGFGIFCGHTGQIGVILLPSNNLNGRIPDDLRLLPELDHLDLSNNSLTGLLPQLDGSSLTWLSLSHNSFVGTIGDIDGVASIPTLQVLDLSYNMLSGSVPATLGLLEKMQTLSLDNNRLRGTIPIELDSLVDLRILTLANNDLSGTIPQLLMLPQLDTIDLSGNFLSGTIAPNAYGMTTTLRIVDMSNNMLYGTLPLILAGQITQHLLLYGNILEGPIPDTIGFFSFLETFDVSMNALTGLIPQEIGQATALRSLFLSRNSFALEQIPTSLANLSNLRELSLRDLALVGTIPTQIGLLTQLRLLDLSENSLEGVVPTELALLTSLRFLLLNHNLLSGTVPESFALLRHLDLLYLNSNELRGNVDSICVDLSIREFVADCANSNVISCSCCSICCKYGDDICNVPGNLANVELSIANNFNRTSYVFGDRSVFTANHLINSSPTWSPTRNPNEEEPPSPFVTPTRPEFPTHTPTMSPTRPPRVPTTATRMDYLLEFLISSGVNSRITIAGTAENRAAFWITEADPLELPLPLNDSRTLERWALALLYFATAGDNWFEDYNFLSELEVCAWQRNSLGVLCGNSGEVISLFLPSNNLQGNLPSDVFMLSDLTQLYLSNNSLTGTIPSFYSDNLEWLSLDHNQLVGGISSTDGIAFAREMRTLDLSYNRLDGTIPDAITNLWRLQLFSLDDNMFYGTIPVGLQFSTDLVTVTLANNYLTGPVMSGLLYMPTIRSLDLSGNFLTGSLSSVVAEQATSLRVLDLSNNMLTGELPDLWTGWATQTALLYGNLLTGSIPTSIGRLESLEVLDMSMNLFTGSIPTEIGLLTNLRSLFLSSNDFSLTGGGFASLHLENLTALRELSLRGVGLQGTIPATLALLTDLILLDLGSNQLNGILFDFDKLVNLRFLLLNRNSLIGTIPSSFLQLQQLDLLYLDHNRLVGSAEFLCVDTMTLVKFSADCASTGTVVCPCCTTCCNEEDDSCNAPANLANINSTGSSDFARASYVFDENTKFLVSPER